MISFSDHNKAPLLTELDKIFKLLQENLPVLENIFAGSEASPSLVNLYAIGKSENISLHNENAILRERMNELETKLEKYVDYSRVCDKVEEMFEGWRDTIKEDTKRYVKDSVKESIGGELIRTFADVVKESQGKVIGEDIKKTFANVVKESQDSIKVETEKWFEKSLTSALQDSQEEIIQHTAIRHDADMFEKEKRSRNIAIGHIPESKAATINDKIKADVEIVAKLANISKDRIEKCYRAGHPLGSGVNVNRTTPRPLIVVLDSPELAQKLHRYSTGNKVLHEGTEYWINPDLTRAERIANYNARELHRKRRADKDGNRPRTEN